MDGGVALEATSPLKKIALAPSQNPVPDFIIKHHISESLKRGLPGIQLEKAHDKPLDIIASGPSVSRYLYILRWSNNDKVAVNGGANYLADEGVGVKYLALLDPMPFIADIFEPLDDVIYLVATQCHPAVFGKLCENNVVTWNAKVGAGEEEVLPPGSLYLGGGSSVGARAINLGYALGYRYFNLYGFDCCVSRGQRRCYSQGVGNQEKLIDVALDPYGKESYISSGSLARNAQNLVDCLKAFDIEEMVDKFTLRVFGKTLFSDMLKKHEFTKLQIEVVE